MSPSTLYRFAGSAAAVCAAVLVFNAARRAGLLPENALTHAIAPFAALTGLLALTGLYLRQRVESGALGFAGYALAAAGLAGAFAVEYVLHFVFPYLAAAQRDALVDGSTGRAFLVTSVVLLAGVLLFGAASLRAGVYPRLAVILFTVGMVPGSLRNVVPVAVFLTGLALAAAGVAWMGAALWRSELARIRRGASVLP